MLTIFSPHISPRLRYIVAVLFNESVILTDNVEIYLSKEGPCINYSNQSIDKGIQVIPVTLLKETEISIQEIQIHRWQDLPVFFSGSGDIPFDIFAASFYLLSRYEEYLNHEKDEYGRYDHRNSIAFQHGFLDIPLVDYWMLELERELQKKYPDYHLPERQFVVQPTYDIDVAYRFRYASPFKNIKGYFTDLLMGRFDALMDRSAIYSGKQKDSYDIYEWLDELHQQHQLKPFYFFLVAEKRKGYDKNVDPHTSGMRELINTHAKKYRIGIHPSVQSNADANCLEREIKLLAYHAQQPISVSRQHYLQLHLPETYQALIDMGIQQDYSMGYGAVNGFRASTSHPFYWYDLSKEQTTSLQIIPFCYMDSTAIFYERLNAEMALERMRYFLQTVKKTSGVFTYVMHNHFLTEQKEWIMWRNMYETFLRTI
ncbi:polysaccharide deacetylase family protein [Sediminibacterium sp.]|uniref:polysaccharide deacetylase family protein n=1 Tax=Sediminibacterium sp. TaxID=1917865 RepID=UPI0025DA3D3D|nr:polysaccharide deacetylase family protein [Sediminibacterium sp.]MBW0178910.1 polysaccharide deacetylase family protein [Sediminibacterium sp.]